MGCGEFIAVKLPVSDKYAIDGPVGTNDEGATIKNRERKRKHAVCWAQFQPAGCWCVGRARNGKGWCQCKWMLLWDKLQWENQRCPRGLLPASQGRGCICASEIESYMQFYMDTGCKTDKNSHKCVLWDRQPALRGQRGFSPRWEKFCACTPGAREGLSTLQITNTHTQSKPPHQAALPPWTPPEGWREIAPDHPGHSAASGDIWPLQQVIQQAAISVQHTQQASSAPAP